MIWPTARLLPCAWVGERTAVARFTRLGFETGFLQITPKRAPPLLPVFEAKTFLASDAT
jgi:hypothetical protein